MNNRPRPHHLHNLDDITQHNIETIASMERLAQRQRTWPVRMADMIAAFCGSWVFLVLHALWFAVWITFRIEPFPFSLLTMIVSLEAIFLSTIIMISQNHQGRLAERRNHLDLQINLLAEQESTETLRLLRAVANKLEVKIKDKDEAALEEETKPDKILHEIEKRVEENGGGGKN